LTRNFDGVYLLEINIWWSIPFGNKYMMECTFWK
jgi:hypothetical protein